MRRWFCIIHNFLYVLVHRLYFITATHYNVTMCDVIHFVIKRFWGFVEILACSTIRSVLYPLTEFHWNRMMSPSSPQWLFWIYIALIQSNADFLLTSYIPYIPISHWFIVWVKQSINGGIQSTHANDGKVLYCCQHCCVIQRFSK